jgi:hypothetical protein
MKGKFVNAVNAAANKNGLQSLLRCGARLPILKSFGCIMKLENTVGHSVNLRFLTNKSGAGARTACQACMAGSEPHIGSYLFRADIHREAFSEETFFSNVFSRRVF